MRGLNMILNFNSIRNIIIIKSEQFLIIPKTEQIHQV